MARKVVLLLGAPSAPSSPSLHMSAVKEANRNRPRRNRLCVQSKTDTYHYVTTHYTQSVA